MDEDKKISNDGPDLFVKYSDEISGACQRAVREALLKHKRAGNLSRYLKTERLFCYNLKR